LQELPKPPIRLSQLTGLLRTPGLQFESFVEKATGRKPIVGPQGFILELQKSIEAGRPELPKLEALRLPKIEGLPEGSKEILTSSREEGYSLRE